MLSGDYMSKKTKLKKGELENDTHRRCQQIKCEFFTNGGCKKCDDCGSASYEINKTCLRCIKCEGIRDSLRWNDGKKKNKLTVGIPKEEIMALSKEEIKKIVLTKMMKDRLLPPEEIIIVPKNGNMQ